MATWLVNNSTSLGGEVLTPWQANHAYTLGARCVCSITNIATKGHRVFECTTAGTSAAITEPTWDLTVGNTTADGLGTLVWTCRDPSAVGASWDNATLFRYAGTKAADDDIILVDQSHSETYAAVITIYFSAVSTTPIKVYCVDKDNSNALSVGALFGTTASNALSLQGSLYSYGVRYTGGSVINLGHGTTANSHMIFEGNAPSTILIDFASGNNNGQFVLSGGTYPVKVQIVNGGIHMYGTGGAYFQGGGGSFEWTNGVLTCAADMNIVFQPSSGQWFIKNVDLSAMCAGAGAKYLMAWAAVGNTNLLFERCKLPSGAGFAIRNAAPTTPTNIKLRIHHCSSANKSYDFYEEDAFGNIQDETTIKRTGGAADPDAVGISWKMVSTALTEDNLIRIALASPPIVGWLASAASQTLTIHGVYDSVTNLQDDEVWAEVRYPADNTSGLGSLTSTKCAVLGTPADLTASTETWTTTGLTNPNKFKFALTIDPGKTGPFEVVIHLAKASTTIYIDPMVTIT
jgi:hypothetical protein